MSTVTSAMPQLPRASLPNRNVNVTIPSAWSPVTIAYAAAITPDIGSYNIFNVGTLTGNITINNPTGTPQDGQTATFRFVQDGTGRTLTWDTDWDFGTDITAAGLPTTASAIFEVVFRYDALSDKFRAVQWARGF